ncbi:MAG: ABC transporter permease [Turicibacter sp.]
MRQLSYKANAIMFFLGDGIILIVTYYLWKAIYGSSEESIINGFTFNEMVIYVIMSFLTSLIISTDISYDIMSEVKDGSIAINLVRPINYEKRMLFQGLGNVLYNFVVIFIIGSIALTLFLYHSGMTLSIWRVIAYFISIVFGILLNFYYSYMFGLLSFKFTNMWGLSQIMGAITQLLSGALIPIVFFPEWAQGLFNFLPFSSMIYTPTMIYLGKISGMEVINALVIQIIWVIILSLGAKILWKKLIKQLVILGG